VTKFFSSPKPPDQLWGHLASYLLGNGIISQGVKPPGNEVDHCLPSGAEDTNEWSCSYVPSWHELGNL